MADNKKADLFFCRFFLTKLSHTTTVNSDMGFNNTGHLKLFMKLQNNENSKTPY